jgi:hypothetical protein
MTVVEVVEVERTCKECGATKPLTDFPLAGHDNPRWRLYSCRPCAADRKRSYRNGSFEANRLIVHAPDPAPAIRLRLELQARREAGWHFDDAWSAALNTVLYDLGRKNRAEWSATLGDTRGAWESAYLREGPAGGLHTLID